MGSCPDLPGSITCGETVKSAFLSGSDGLIMFVIHSFNTLNASSTLGYRLADGS